MVSPPPAALVYFATCALPCCEVNPIFSCLPLPCPPPPHSFPSSLSSLFALWCYRVSPVCLVLRTPALAGGVRRRWVRPPSPQRCVAPSVVANWCVSVGGKGCRPFFCYFLCALCSHPSPTPLIPWPCDGNRDTHTAAGKGDTLGERRRDDNLYSTAHTFFGGVVACRAPLPIAIDLIAAPPSLPPFPFAACCFVPLTLSLSATCA